MKIEYIIGNSQHLSTPTHSKEIILAKKKTDRGKVTKRVIEIANTLENQGKIEAGKIKEMLGESGIKGPDIIQQALQILKEGKPPGVQATLLERLLALAQACANQMDLNGDVTRVKLPQLPENADETIEEETWQALDSASAIMKLRLPSVSDQQDAAGETGEKGDTSSGKNVPTKSTNKKETPMSDPTPAAERQQELEAAESRLQELNQAAIDGGLIKEGQSISPTMLTRLILTPEQHKGEIETIKSLDEWLKANARDLRRAPEDKLQDMQAEAATLKCGAYLNPFLVAQLQRAQDYKRLRDEYDDFRQKVGEEEEAATATDTDDTDAVEPSDTQPHDASPGANSGSQRQSRWDKVPEWCKNLTAAVFILGLIVLAFLAGQQDSANQDGAKDSTTASATEDGQGGQTDGQADEDDKKAGSEKEPYKLPTNSDIEAFLDSSPKKLGD